MRILKRIAQTAVIAAAMCAMLCQGASAKGVDTNYTQVNGEVAKGARNKYTKLRGKGKDSVTMMVYMLGTDLESQSGMATADLNEMLYAGLDNKKVNVIVQTGGCKRWRNSVISAGKTQRWSISGKGIGLLEEEKTKTSMTDEDELSDFIKYCAKKAPADRYILVFWDHGGGSVSGYGYDETHPNDSMNIGEISKGLKNGGVKFDIVGFDCCLMGTLETAIAVEPYADYMIASEETEPGTGWYYTNWLKLLNENSSANSLNLGRQICDDFTAKNAMYASSTGTTLSVVDLAELGGTVEGKLGAFGSDLTTQLTSNNYQSVATARNGSREFSPSARLDQVDLVDFCTNLNTKESKSLASAIQSAVKYNRVNGISNAYGLSIYFPNSSLKSVNSMIQICEDIGVDSEWTEGIRTYATLEQSGQIVANNGYSYGSGSGSLLDILLGSGNSGSGSYNYTSGSGSSGGGGSFLGSLFQDASSGSYSSSSDTGSLLEALLGGTTTQQPQSSGSGLLEALFGGSGSSSQNYNSYSSYGSMSEQDIYNMLMQAYSQGSGSGYTNAYSGNYGGYGNGSSSSLLDLLTGGYASTSGSYYGVNDYSSILGNSGYNTSSGSDLLSVAAQMLFGRAVVGSETLELTEKDGQSVLELDEDMWDQITDVELNVFVDDGDGYIDLGLDNVIEYNDDGDLIDDWNGTWLTVEDRPVALYPISDEDQDGNGLYITTKFTPVLVNGERMNLVIEFNEETGEDTVLGAQDVTPTGVQGKGYRELEEGDIIQPVCDYFGYDGTFMSAYELGDPFIVPEDGQLTVVNKKVTGGDRMLYTARLTDYYQANYWLPMTEYTPKADPTADTEAETADMAVQTEAETAPAAEEATEAE
ncbi:MAG: hypothetical protein IJ820_06380 [Lachnospiraceae bacterium]|nr:hypothetical protein [Lachnospiraceae bacterium]